MKRLQVRFIERLLEEAFWSDTIEIREAAFRFPFCGSVYPLRRCKFRSPCPQGPQPAGVSLLCAYCATN